MHKYRRFSVICVISWRMN